MPASQVETLTADTFLMHKVTTSSGSSYVKLVCIKDYPDIGGSPEPIEVTDLCDHAQRFIEGIKSGEQMEFTCNYTKEDFATLDALTGQTAFYGVYFGSESGSEGKFTFQGQLSVRVNGGGVNEVVEMTISIAPSTEISFA